MDDAPKFDMQYEIVDTENPENNVTIDANPPTEEARREEAMARVAHLARIKIAEAINRRRERENTRAMKGRVASRRRKASLQKVSRKKNRG